MVTVLAPVTAQLKVVVCPEVILAGFTSKFVMAIDAEVVPDEDGPQPGPMQTASIIITVRPSHLIFIVLLLYDLDG